MTWELIQNGSSIGAVTNLRRLPGKQEFTRIPTGGGRTEVVPGLKELDEFTFSVSSSHGIEMAASHVLQGVGANEAIPIMIDNIQGTSVHAVMKPTPRS